MAILIVGSDGQDGRILSNILEKSNEKYFRLNSIGIFLKRQLLLPVKQFTPHNLAIFFRNFNISKIFFFAAHSQSTSEINDINFATEIETRSNVISRLLKTLLSALELDMNRIKFFFASSSLIFAGSCETPQTEYTKLAPLELYSREKIKNTEYLKSFRDSYSFFELYVGIFYNHESIFRKKGFFSRKVIEAAKLISKDPKKDYQFSLFDVDFILDMSHASDFMENLNILLEIGNPGEYIFSSETPISTLNFVTEVFGFFNLNLSNYLQIIENPFERRNLIPLRGINYKLKSELGDRYFQDSTKLSERLCREWILKLGNF